MAGGGTHVPPCRWNRARWFYDVLPLRLSNATPLPPLARLVRPSWTADDWNARLSRLSPIWSGEVTSPIRTICRATARGARVPLHSGLPSHPPFTPPPYPQVMHLAMFAFGLEQEVCMCMCMCMCMFAFGLEQEV